MKKINTTEKLKPIKFRISSGLKNLIGSELITDDFVAIFELVKNSFDALATRVDIYFLDHAIYIVDNGKGMTYEDLLNKWLFVAYSAKRDGTEDVYTQEELDLLDNHSLDYRQKLDSLSGYAGNKGVGRFSCDRLGENLQLQSRSVLEKTPNVVQALTVDWHDFEEDGHREFVDIPVKYQQLVNFKVDKEISLPEKNIGTVLVITKLRAEWDRNKLIALKRELAKLINPFDAEHNDFQIHIYAPNEIEADKNILSSTDDDEGSYYRVVNGVIRNFIFNRILERTTYITVELSQDALFLESQLIDRGELIYKIREPNVYGLLKGTNFKSNLYYLNFAAKQIFARRMGIASVKFGSVFLFRNNFRVYPIGEEADDTFGIDRRKAQGYARYLGTRDIIGRIDVHGDSIQFDETTSRDKGLIETPASKELMMCFMEKVFKRLENYVVDVTWADKFDKEYTDISRLTTDNAKNRIINIVSKLAESEDIELLDFNSELVSIINEKADIFENSLNRLKIVAEKSSNLDLLDEINKAEKRYIDLLQAEKDAREQTKIEIEKREKAEKVQKKTEEKLKEEQKRNQFLVAHNSVDKETIEQFHHQIIGYATRTHTLLENRIDILKHNEQLTADQLMDTFEQLILINQRILAISRFATKANFRLDSTEVTGDIIVFLEEYIEQICKIYDGDQVKINFHKKDDKTFSRKFEPIDLTIVIDNLITNARKASASKIDFNVQVIENNQLKITVINDGEKIDERFVENPQEILEKGVTSTDGSGLGLYHSKSIIEKMDGRFTVEVTNERDLEFIIGLNK